MNRFQEIANIKQLDIVEYLKLCGHHPVKTQGERVWYLSPLRSEKTPSFCVYIDKIFQDWFDFGSGDGGSIIDLVMAQKKCGYPEAIKVCRMISQTLSQKIEV